MNNKKNNNEKLRNDEKEMPQAEEAVRAEKENPPAGMITISQAEYDALKAKSEECGALKDKSMRDRAEFENIRKRLEKDKIEFAKYANEGFIFELLPILDNLEIAEKHIKEAKDFKAVQEGIDMIQMQIQMYLKDVGLERLSTVGKKFDPNEHEPVETEDIPEKEEGLIIGELKPGYRYNGKLLRTPLVKIVKHGGEEKK